MTRKTKRAPALAPLSHAEEAAEIARLSAHIAASAAAQVDDSPVDAAESLGSAIYTSEAGRMTALKALAVLIQGATTYEAYEAIRKPFAAGAARAAGEDNLDLSDESRRRIGAAAHDMCINGTSTPPADLEPRLQQRAKLAYDVGLNTWSRATKRLTELASEKGSKIVFAPPEKPKAQSASAKANRKARAVPNGTIDQWAAIRAKAEAERKQAAEGTPEHKLAAVAEHEAAKAIQAIQDAANKGAKGRAREAVAAAKRRIEAAVKRIAEEKHALALLVQLAEFADKLAPMASADAVAAANPFGAVVEVE